MKCKSCGTEIKENEFYCHICGNKISNNSSSNLDKQKKIIIIALLTILLVALSALAFIIANNKNNQRTLVGDGSRTIMIYMVGSNLEYEGGIATSDLNGINPDEIDLEHINILLYTGGTKKWHNFISNEENALYILKEDGFEKIESYKKENMGSPKTLVQLLDYGYKNYQTDYYDLVLYNHGGAIDGAIYDDFTSDNLSLADLRKALKDSSFSSNNKLNTVTFRTCLNGTIEVANVFAPYANYLIASEEVTNGKAPASVLKFLNEVTTEDSDIEYGKKFINAYDLQIQEIDPLGFSTVPMYSIIDLSKIEKVNELLNDFISSVDIKNHYQDIVKIRSNMYQYGYDSNNVPLYDQVDLYTLILQLSKYSDEDNTKLIEALEDAIVYNWSEKEKNSHGLSIYFPYNGAKAYQTKFLGIYNDLNINDSYYKFIKSFNSNKTSNKPSAFTISDVKENNSNISNGEFSLQLTESQVTDYAESLYIVFEKNDDGLFTPIYSSNNTELDESGLLKTNISNNLIKIYDKSDQNDNGGYFTLIERTSENTTSVITNGILSNYDSQIDIKDWTQSPVSIHFYRNADGTIETEYISREAEEKGVSGYIIDPNNYKNLTVLGSNYKILDENGKYTEKWDNNEIISGWEVQIKDLEFKSATLEPDKDYYCVFKIADIYGNEYYSELQSLN